MCDLTLLESSALTHERPPARVVNADDHRPLRSPLAARRGSLRLFTDVEVRAPTMPCAANRLRR